MGFFTNDNKQPNGKEQAGAATIIAINTKFKGEVTTECHFHTDGEFEGTIKSKNTVMVGKSGSVIGDIVAQKLIISGNVKGNVEAKTIEILAGGRLEGAITADELVIERKGIFIGESKNNPTISDSPKLINTEKPKILESKPQ